jgi:hypothetical protein
MKAFTSIYALRGMSNRITHSKASPPAGNQTCPWQSSAENHTYPSPKSTRPPRKPSKPGAQRELAENYLQRMHTNCLANVVPQVKTRHKKSTSQYSTLHPRQCYAGYCLSTCWRGLHSSRAIAARRRRLPPTTLRLPQTFWSSTACIAAWLHTPSPKTPKHLLLA